VWNPLYDVRVDRVDRVQRRFIRYALRGLGWTDMHDLPPYEYRCALLHLDTLTKRQSIDCVMFIFDVVSGRVNLPNLWSVLDLITPRYPTRGAEFLRIDFHRTNYGMYEPMSSAIRQFSEVIGLFDFGLTLDQFLNRLRLTLKAYPILHRFLESIVHCHATVHYPFQRSIWSVEVSIRRINSFS
jgi:hypothetical protein